MNETCRWYWAYTSPGIGCTTYLFNTIEEARDHAIDKGEFDEICNKDAWCAFEEEFFFEVREDDLHEYTPAVSPLKIKTLQGLLSHPSVESFCDDCGRGIIEYYYTNDKGQSVHTSTGTNGHYYSDASARCDACHDASR